MKTNDYTTAGMSAPTTPLAGTRSVVIPAGQTVATVTLTPVDDTVTEPNETAAFSIAANALYTVGTPNGLVINIVDNDTATMTLKDTADAFVQDGANAGANFGTVSELQVKSAGTGLNRVTYLKFDLAGVTAITAAQLELFGNVSNTQDPTITTGLFTVDNTSWSETGINFNNAPPLSASAIASVAVAGTTAKKYTFDVAAFLQAQMAAGHHTVSFALKNPATSNSFLTFRSKESASNPPDLLLTVPASNSVGTFSVAAPAKAELHESVNFAITWQVPSGSWQQLHTIDLRLLGDNGSVIDIVWNQENATLALLDQCTGEFGMPKAIGSNAVLASSQVKVSLAKSSRVSTGATSPLVTVTFSLSFLPTAAHHYTIQAEATNDTAIQSAFVTAGTMTNVVDHTGWCGIENGVTASPRSRHNSHSQ